MIDNSNGPERTQHDGQGWDGTGCRRSRVPLRHRVQEQEAGWYTFKTVGGDIGASGHLVAKEFDVGGACLFDPELSVYQITEDGLSAEDMGCLMGCVVGPVPQPEKTISDSFEAARRTNTKK